LLLPCSVWQESELIQVRAAETKTPRVVPAALCLTLAVGVACVGPRRASSEHAATAAARITPPADPLAAYPLTALERRLLDDAGDRRLDQIPLLDAALIASGITEQAELSRWRDRLERRLAPVLADVDGTSPPAARGRALLAALHRHLLARYDTRATTIQALLEHGEYNCVTATVLYNELAHRAGLLVKAVMLPSHVYTLVFTADGPIEVETTSPHGFDPDRSSRDYLRFLVERELHRAQARLGGEDETAAPGIAAAAEIDNLTLVSVILTNRALGAVEGGDPALAFGLLERSRLLAQPDRAAMIHAHEASVVNGMALAAAEQGNCQVAVRLLDAVHPTATSDLRKVLLHNRFYCVERMARREQDAGRHASAIELLDDAIAVDPGRDEIHAARVVAYNRWGVELAEARRFGEAVRVLERALRAEPEEVALRHNLAAVLHNHALQKVRAGDCPGARSHIERGLDLGDLHAGFLELREACAR